MNEREEFLQNFRSAFIKMVERLDTMTESQILDGLLEVRTARNVYEAEFAQRIGAITQAGPGERPRVARAKTDTREEMARLVSIQAFFNSVNKLKTRAGTKAPPLGGRSHFDLLEDALNDRLESRGKRPGSDS